MRPCRHLSNLNRQATYRFNSLATALDLTRTPSVADHVRRKLVGSITIDTLNTWANFSRAFYLSCCLGAYLPGHGRVSTALPFVSFNDSIVLATITCKPWVRASFGVRVSRRDEPAWHDVNILLQSCRAAGVSNYPLIASAASIGTRVFTDLAVFRNYYGHKNSESERAAKNLATLSAVPRNLRPFEMLLRRPIGKTEPLLKIWINDLETVASLLCT